MTDATQARLALRRAAGRTSAVTAYPCQLVNPLCPVDLCELPYRHRGQHRLSTMGERGPVGPLLRRHRGAPLDADGLVALGEALAERLFPEDAR